MMAAVGSTIGIDSVSSHWGALHWGFDNLVRPSFLSMIRPLADHRGTGCDTSCLSPVGAMRLHKPGSGDRRLCTTGGVIAALFFAATESSGAAAETQSRADTSSPVAKSDGRRCDFSAAILSKRRSAVQSLIDVGCDVNPQVAVGQTPLWLAYRAGNVGAFELLLSRGANPNVLDSELDTPLNKAVQSSTMTEHDGCKHPATHNDTCGSGSRQMVKFLLGHRTDPNIPNRYGVTPLLFAVSRRSRDIVQDLLNAGARVSAADNSGWTALHLAARNGDLELSALLLGRGADPRAKDRDGNTPLHFAASPQQGERRNNIQLVDLLIEKGAGVAEPNVAGRTALHIAAHVAATSIARRLIGAGTPVNVKDGQGRTPLLEASLGGDHLEMTRLLLEKGADPNLTDVSQMTLLHWLSRSSTDGLRAARLIIAHVKRVDALDSSGRTPLFHAIALGVRDVARLLLSSGADPNAAARSGVTPLHVAAFVGDEIAIDMLLAAGARVDVIDSKRRTPLHWAAFFGRKTVVRRLLDANAGALVRDTNNRTPLDWAVAGCNRAVADVIARTTRTTVPAVSYRSCPASLGAGPPQQARGHRPENLHDLAAAGGTGVIRAMEALIRGGADLNAVDELGRTALHVAALSRNVDGARSLLSAGANPHLADSAGDTPLHLVGTQAGAMAAPLTIATTLLEGGADPDAPNLRGRTPLHAICDETIYVDSHATVARYLICKGANASTTDRFGWTAADVAFVRGWPAPDIARCDLTSRDASAGASTPSAVPRLLY